MKQYRHTAGIESLNGIGFPPFLFSEGAKEQFMPWEIVAKDGKHCVVKKGEDKPLGCHDTEDEAKKQIAALEGKAIWVTVEQMKAICPSCAEAWAAKGWDRVNIAAGEWSDAEKPVIDALRAIRGVKASADMDAMLGDMDDDMKAKMKACMKEKMDGGMKEEEALASCKEMFEGKSVSFDEQAGRVREAWRAQHPSAAESAPDTGWVMEVYPDHVILSKDGKYYSATYAVSEDKYLFAAESDWVAVERAYVPTENNALKAISRTETELRVGNYMMLFGGRDLEGIGTKNAKGARVGLTRKNGDGSIGEFFSKATDWSSPYTETGVVYVDWEHGFEPDTDRAVKGPGRDDVLGYVDLKSARTDEKGVFVERVLNRRNRYVKWLEELIDAGLVGNSTEALPNAKSVKATGEIERWPLRRDTLTVTPVEPRQLTENQIRALKSIGIDLQAEAEAAGNAAPQATVTGTNINQIPGGENGATEMDEIKAVLEKLDAIEKNYTAVKDELTAVKAALPATNAPSGLVINPVDDRPFKSLGEQLMWVVRATNEHTRSEAREKLEHVKAYNENVATKAGIDFKATGASEGTPADGGFLVQTDFAQAIFEKAYNEGLVASKCAKQTIGAQFNSVKIPSVDETSRVNGSRYGGVLAYWGAEAGSLTKSKPTFRQIELNLKKLHALMYATDELLMDAAALESFVMRVYPKEIMFKVDDGIIEGTGAGLPVGILTAACTYSLAVETNQTLAASAILTTNLSKMWSHLWPAGRPNAYWLVNADCEPWLDELTIPAGTAAVEPRFVKYNDQGLMTIKGRPVVTIEQASALGTVGDIMLVDLSQYLLADKGGIQAASSMHVQFTTDEMTFRWTYRIDGQPAWSSTLTPFKGSTTLAPFVTLAART